MMHEIGKRIWIRHRNEKRHFLTFLKKRLGNVEHTKNLHKDIYDNEKNQVHISNN